MLLLILCAGCLALSAGQTTSFTSTTTGTSPQATLTFMATTPPTSPPFLPSDSMESALAILQTVVESTQELNETTIAPVLNKLSDIIQRQQPDLKFHLTVKNITRVPRPSHT